MRWPVAQASFTLVILIHSAAFVLCSNFSAKFPTDGQLIAVGGDNDDGYLADVDIISLSTNTHKPAALIPAKLASFGSTMMNNTIYVVGGGITGGSVSSFLAYDITANKWTNLPDFPYKIVGNAAVAVKGSIYSLGGYSADYGGGMDYAFKYDASTRVWARIPSLLPHIQMDACVVAHQSSIYWIANTGDLFRSDDGAHTWYKRSSMLQSRLYPTCATLADGSIMVAGGSVHGSSQSSVELYNIDINAWQSITPMRRKRESARAVTIPDSESVLVCGGYNNGDKKHYDDCELFSTEENQWKLMDFKLSVPRKDFGLFLC